MYYQITIRRTARNLFELYVDGSHIGDSQEVQALQDYVEETYPGNPVIYNI